MRIVRIPIGWEGEEWVLVAGSQHADFPTDEERLLLSVGANQAAMMLQRKQAEEELRESEERFRRDFELGLTGMARLQEVSTRLVHGSDPTPLLQEIVDAAIEITAADMGNIRLFDPKSGTLRIVASRGLGLPFLEFFQTVHAGQGTYGGAVHNGDRVVVEDVTTSPVFAGTPLLDIYLAAGIRAVQSTPLIGRSGQLVGVLSTDYLVPRRPADRDLSVLDTLARQAAALDRENAGRGGLAGGRGAVPRHV